MKGETVGVTGKLSCIYYYAFIMLCIVLLPAHGFAGWQTDTIPFPTKMLGLNSSRSIALEPLTGYPHIVYGGDALYHAWYDGSEWRYETVESGISVGMASVVMDGANRLHISYYDSTNQDLKYASDVSGSWAVSTIDSTGTVGFFNSIAIDGSNRAHISYYDSSGQDLKYATNASGSWILSVLDASGDVGEDSSIAIDLNGKVHISYIEYLSASSQKLRYVTNSPGFWLASVIDSAGVSSAISLATDSSNKVHIAYARKDGSVTYIRYATNASGSWVIALAGDSVIDQQSFEPSLAVDSGGKVHIGYRNNNTAQCSNCVKYASNDAGSWTSSFVDLTGGNYPSLALDGGDAAHINYLNLAKDKLKYAYNASGAWNVSEVDRNVVFDYSTPSCIAVDTNAHAHIMKVSKEGSMYYASNASGSWEVSEITGDENAGNCDMLTDASGYIHVSYYDMDSSSVMYLSNMTGAWVNEAVDSAGGPSYLVLDQNYKVHIAYKSPGGARYATNASGAWVTELIDSNGESPKAIRIDASGKAHVVFRNTVSNMGIYYATNASGVWISSFVYYYHYAYTIDDIRIDSQNKIHLIYDSLIYATNASGTWVEETVPISKTTSGFDDIYDYSGALTLDSGDNVHILHSFAACETGTAGCKFGTDTIFYATNAHGYWLVYDDLPGTSSQCTSWWSSWSRCMEKATYELDLALDANGNSYYITSTSFGYGTYLPVIGDAALDTGWDHTVHIRPDGTLWAWGVNDQGQLGDGTRTDRHEPVQIGSDNDWAAVSAGWRHTIALKRNGSLWAWGDNEYGQIGDGTATDRLSPVQIGTGTDWTKIAAGGAHNLAIRANKTLWGWGLNVYGQVGDGTVTSRYSPVQIGSDTGWTSISAGWEHSAGLRGTYLYTWGWNEKGQLGDGTTINKASPFQMGTGYSSVSAGWQHTLGIKSGQLWAWGYNEFGQLGDGTLIDRHNPVRIGTTSDWVKLSAGAIHNLALKTANTLHAWGGNFQGQVGDGSTTMRTAPVPIGSATDWADIAAGWEHSAGLKDDLETVLTWGWNYYGQIGDGTTTNRLSPVQIGFDSLPVADFTGSPSRGCDSLTVNFTDETTGGDGPLSYYWEFESNGDAGVNQTTSTEQNPTVAFWHTGESLAYGLASVRLTVTDADGDVDVIYKENYVRIDRMGPPFGVLVGGCYGDVIAGFSASQTSGGAPLTVSFTNSTTGYSPPFSYEWDFDNNGVVDSTEENPSYIYNSAGTYTVQLKATDPYGRTDTISKTNYIVVNNSIPVADFTALPTYGCALPTFTVEFANLTTGGDGPLTYEWDFDYYNYNLDDEGDGSTTENPSFEYYLIDGTQPVGFTVSLTVTDTDGDSDTMVKLSYITADPTPVCSTERTHIDGTTQYYYLLQDAYDAALNGETILSMALTFSENLYFDQDKSIALDGGYDTGYSTNTGTTIISGDIYVSSGTVTVQSGRVDVR